MCDRGAERKWRRGLWALVIGLCLVAAPAVAEEGADEASEGAAEEVVEDEGGDRPTRGPQDGPVVPEDQWADVDGDEEGEEGEEGEPAQPGLDGPRIPRADLSAPADADPEFEAALEDYRDAFERYAMATQEYQATMEDLVRTEFDRRMAQINAAFDPQIRERQAIERQRRLEALESLEALLADYPSDEEHTPDALFRLALLYDQIESDEYDDANREYFELMDQTEDFADLPDPPIRSYERSQGMFNRLIDEWQDYRGIDLAYYFMAHIEWEQGNADRARDLAEELIRRHPDSEFVPHGWLMIGEFFFEDAERDGEEHIRDNLMQALEAFKIAGSEEGREQLTDANYIRAVYSWAWSKYRLEDYPGAIGIFKRVVEVIEETASRTGQRRDALREDSIGHLAEIIAIEDWDLTGEIRADDTVLNRVREHLSDGQGYEREVLEKLGEELFGFLRFAEAIDVYEYLLEQDPLHPDNPEIHSRIVVALHRDFQEEAAFAVRREMMDYYGHESAWYAHQRRRGNEAAILRAENMVRDYLLMAATWYHEQAQTTRNEALVRRDPAMVAVAEEKYAVAADAYRQFLAQFPNDGEIFQWTFYYAETLYYSGQYADAFDQYQVVREMDIPDNPFQEVSAFNAITALEFVMRGQVSAGELTPRAVMGADFEESRDDADSLGQAREFDDELSMEQITVEGEPIPPIVTDYVTAMDRYVVLQLENEQDAYLGAKFAFQAARVYYDFKHNDEARTRFAWIVENYPEHEVAYLAGSLILESYRQENNYAALAEWAEILANVIEGEQAEAVRAEVREYRLVALFRSAEDLYAREEAEAAAEEFLRLAQDAPDHRLAARALNNAGFAFEQAGNFERASEVFERLFTEYPDDDMAPLAVYRVAANSEWLFDFDKAIRHYQLFYDEFDMETPEALSQVGFDIPERREEALLQVAQFNEYMQRYEQAARGYEDFYRRYPESEFAAATLWAAAEAWQKAGNQREQDRVFRQYINEYEGVPEHAERAMRARAQMATQAREAGNQRQELAMYREILDQFEVWREEDEAPRAMSSMRAMAAESKFRIVEQEFEEWDAIRIEGSLQQQSSRLEAKIEGVQELTARYREVMGYQNLDWSLAAYYRQGSLLQRLSEELYEVPIPFDEGTDEYFAYQDMLDDIAFPLEDAAIEQYAETLQRARDAEIVNEWTRRTLEALNHYQPANYPLYKEERAPATPRVNQSAPLMSGEDYQSRQIRRPWGGDDTGGGEL